MSGPPVRDGVVVVHSSDIHVDNGHTARAHGGDGTRGLAAVLAAAADAEADVVLLAGDVFEHNRLPVDLLERTAGLLAEAARPVVILPGNHDPLTPESAYRRGGIAEVENVHVLGLTHDEAVVLDHLDLEIWGRAHHDYADMAPLGGARPRVTQWQIAAAHGHYEAEPDMTTSLRPSWLISEADVVATGADYVALGHWNRHVRVVDGPVLAYYSGSPDLAGTVNRVHLRSDGGVEVVRHPLNIGPATSDEGET